MGAGLDLDDAAVASEVFASKKFKITTVEAFSALDYEEDIKDMVQAASAKDMSKRAVSTIRSFWEKAKSHSELQVIEYFLYIYLPTPSHKRSVDLRYSKS